MGLHRKNSKNLAPLKDGCLWCHGLRNVTTCFGKNTFTDELWQLLDQSCPDKVLIGFDGDTAGDQAAGKRKKADAFLSAAKARVSAERFSKPLG